MALIDLGLIDGNFWNANHVDRLEAAINQSSPAGEVTMTIANTAPAGWLMLNGQVVPNAQTLYPDLWSVAPLAWKSGASLTLPNATQRFPIGGPVGTVGGSSAKTIAAANLPVHVHGISMQTADTGQDHTHGTVDGLGGFVTQYTGGGPSAFDIGAGTGATIRTDTTTGNAHLVHRHDINGATQPVGSGTALDVTPAWIAFNFLIRAY